MELQSSKLEVSVLKIIFVLFTVGISTISIYLLHGEARANWRYP